MSFRIGVDIGGTFTDINLVGPNGQTDRWKQDTTHGRLVDAITAGVGEIARRQDLSVPELLEQTSMFVHGSTVATNTVIERNGPQIALICTKGFRDALYFRDGFKWDRYNARLPRPRDFVEREFRIGVAERINSAGEVLEPLDRDEVAREIKSLVEKGVEVIAVSLLWAHVNGAHERQIREIASEVAPDVPVILSSDILPNVGEWVRTSATVMSAYVFPATSAYLRKLESWLKESGFGKDLLVMQVSGGCAGVERTLQVPVNMIHSGPAAAPTAALALARSADSLNVITTDMGGTSFDVTLIDNGEIPVTRSMEVEHQPIGVPGVEVHSVGAGGGSIAWIDDGGALRVGPQSAGSMPGPVAYDNGGTRPTVTDANLVLGYLSADNFLGGRRKLNLAKASEAIQKSIAEPLGLSVHEAAAGILRIVDEHMVAAIRAVSIERGMDPREYMLVAGGGAGALHAARLADALGVSKVLVPREAGTLSAFGMTAVNLRHDYSATLHAEASSADLDAISKCLTDLETKAKAEMARSGIDPQQIEMSFTVDARYVGQLHEFLVPVSNSEVTAQVIAEVCEQFHDLHEQRFKYRLPGHEIEFIHWRATAFVPTSEHSGAPVAYAAGDGQASPSATREAFVEGEGMRPIDVYGDDVAAGMTASGPCVVDSATTTVLVPRGHILRAVGSGDLLIERSGEQG